MKALCFQQNSAAHRIVMKVTSSKEKMPKHTDSPTLFQEKAVYLLKKEKNFARADEIRAELLEKGIEIKDTREGVVWSRV